MSFPFEIRLLPDATSAGFWRVIRPRAAWAAGLLGCSMALVLIPWAINDWTKQSLSVNAPLVTAVWAVLMLTNALYLKLTYAAPVHALRVSATGHASVQLQPDSAFYAFEPRIIQRWLHWACVTGRVATPQGLHWVRVEQPHKLLNGLRSQFLALFLPNPAQPQSDQTARLLSVWAGWVQLHPQRDLSDQTVPQGMHIIRAHAAMQLHDAQRTQPHTLQDGYV